MTHVSELELRVVDQRGQGVPLGGGHKVPQGLVDLPAHGAGGVAQDVAKALVLPVNVADIVLRALGQVQNGAQVDDLREDLLAAGIAPGQELEHPQGFFVQVLFRHGSSFLPCFVFPAQAAGFSAISA